MKSKCFFLSFLAVCGCSSLDVKEAQLKEIRTNKAYEESIRISDAQATPSPLPSSASVPASAANPAVAKPAPKPVTSGAGANAAPAVSPGPESVVFIKQKPSDAAPVAKKGKTTKKKSQDSDIEAKAPAATPIPTTVKHLPEFEDGEGFRGRRPIVDPFRMGEKVVLDLTYFAVGAGQLTIESLPLKQVNGNLSYHFRLKAVSNPTFNFVYSVNDMAEAFVDYENLIPYNYVIKMNQKKMVGENKALFNWAKMKAYTWERVIKMDKGKEEKVFEWDIEPFTQHVFSVPFYLRTFKLTPGKLIQVKVGHRGKNMIMKARVIRREKMQTPMGLLDTVLVIPQFELDGVFKPVGEIKFWMTDDDQKLRIESKIKIGTITASLVRFERGKTFVVE